MCTQSVLAFSWPVALLFLGLLAAQIVVAFLGGWGTWSQIQRHDAVGLAIIYHGSIWGGLYLWWIMSTIWERYSYQWTSVSSIAVPIIVGSVVAIGMMILWKTGNGLEAHQQTKAGIPLAIQLGAAVAITVAFFGFSHDVPSDFALLVAVLLFVYVFLSAHIVSYAFWPEFYADNPTKSILGLVQTGAAGALLAVGAVIQQNNWLGK